MLPSVIFGILSALTWGAADFFGGMATKRAHPFTVVHVAEWVGAVVLVALALLFGEALPSGTTLLWAAAAGLLGAVGLLALYTALAAGHMGIVAALSAVVAALVPIIFGAFTEGLPAPLQMLGFGMGLVAIWLLTSSHDRTVQPRELWLALIAGLGEVCTREDIIGTLYPNEPLDASGGENRVDSLMRHLRKAVEPAPERPRYLLTVRGLGYKLVDKPE